MEGLNMKLTIDNQTFDVVSQEGEPDEGKKTFYHLTGKRGARWFTMRNKNNPDLMFLVNGKSMKSMKNIWLTDKEGFLDLAKVRMRLP